MLPPSRNNQNGIQKGGSNLWQYNYTQYQDELYHYGRKGMKWGQHIFGKVRTSLGNRRARKAAIKEASKRERAENKARNKSVRGMTSDEIKQRMERMQLEKDYKKLLEDTSNSSKAKAFVMDVLEKAGKDTATQTAAYIGATVVNKLLFDGKDEIDPKNIQNRRKK